ncbi:MAG: MXAN_6640 family putative metalloprotease, partial [Myxococcota bacterium]
MWWMIVGAAFADRPDEGSGLFSFDAADVLAYTDGPTGMVRVHYSIDGPNVTRLDDEDGSGAPDFPELIAETAEDVLRFYDEQGFLSPLSEADLGLGELGGSPAFDFYLVDFGNSSTGNFAIDACAGSQCAGHMLIENDFAGFGFSSLAFAARVLCSHELFHAVQAAYIADQSIWFSEGTATWAVNQYDPGSRDFLGFANAYLDETDRSLDRPPAAPVPAFAYGTALFFQYLTERFGPGTGPDLQQALTDFGSDGGIDAIIDVIAQNGSTLEAEWPRFARWNLATGFRTGDESYPFADLLGGIRTTTSGETALVDDNRFYPLAASYFRLEHPGGDVNFASAEDLTGLTFSLHPENGAALEIWSPQGPDARTFPSLDAGRYWLVGSYPAPAAQSVKAEFCLGRDCDLSVIDDANADSGSPDAPEPQPRSGCATTDAATAGGRAPAARLWFGRVRAARVRVGVIDHAEVAVTAQAEFCL